MARTVYHRNQCRARFPGQALEPDHRRAGPVGTLDDHQTEHAASEKLLGCSQHPERIGRSHHPEGWAL